MFQPAQANSEEAADRPVRSIHVIEEDNVGEPISFPTAIYYDREADEVYLNDGNKGQIVIYAAADYFPQLAVGAGRGLGRASSAYVNGGKIYFCVNGDGVERPGHIAVFNAALLPIDTISFSGLPEADTSTGFIPRRMVIGQNGLLYVVGLNASSVKVFDPEGRYLREIRPRDDVLGVREEAKIVSLANDETGRLYFLSEELGRIFVYDRNENFLFKFGQKGGGSGKLARPRGIAVDRQRGRIVVVDYLRHGVTVYSDEGVYLFEFGGRGVGRGWFNYPSDVAIDGQGHLLIADTFNHRVQVFEVQGDRLTAMTDMSKAP